MEETGGWVRDRSMMGKNGRVVTPREMEEYQYHASLPPTLKSLPGRLCPPVSYYRLGKIIFDYEYPSQTRASRTPSFNFRENL